MKRRKPEIYLRREFDDVLVAWHKRGDRLPLIIDGARQIGKSECVRHFAEGRYESFVEINFAEETRGAISGRGRADFSRISLARRW